MSTLYLPIFEEKEGVRAFFSTKAGASLQSPYYNKKVLEELSLQNCRLVWPEQVHQTHIEVIRESAESREPVRAAKTDGIITNNPDILLTTVHADCLAVFFYDKKKKAIGLVHAGWRGTVGGIVVKAVKQMESEYGSKPEDIAAFISPGISKCCFETGEEVYDLFLENWKWADAFAEKKGSKYYIDLKGINERQLLEAGVREIQVSGYCTCCRPEMFCSYRREQGTKMRMGAGICLSR
ncbi:peptidoglycan editing factor PgeF [Aminipila luticellarii]|uniref:Purine nucleoside phosphorylase n=1 Tax=Aminipila luticellarii TaxID=2507160 RepID=A0A410PWU9_9FIRM|nr:peptidoglycan editing factor PgeF [Aminipila luticellarii]QAT43385.1 peptidoglycan editing factor PgeF [Aminipila luticellarii]